MFETLRQFKEQIDGLLESDEKRFLLILAGYLIGFLFLLLAIAFQIGRASCRERV